MAETVSLTRIPLFTEYDLTEDDPFRKDKTQRKLALYEIERLKKEIGSLASMSSKNLENAKKYLSNKFQNLNTSTVQGPKEIAQRFYALTRLAICKDVASKLKSENVAATIPEIVTLYYQEGDLAVPICYDSISLYKITPDKSLTAEKIMEYWGGFNSNIFYFFDKHYSFDINKVIKAKKENTHPDNEIAENAIGSTLGINSLYKFREHPGKPNSFANITGIGYKNSSPLSWMIFANKSAFSFYLSLIGGLDFYTYAQHKHPVELFVYNYARNRKLAGVSVSFRDLYKNGKIKYYDVVDLSVDNFVSGKLSPNGLTAVVQKEKPFLHCYIVPVNRINFVATVLTEATIRLEAFRRAPLICGGDAFDPPLPYSLAYIRYCGWDIYFVILVLKILHEILHEILSNKPKVDKSIQPLLKKIAEKIEKIGNKDNEVWKVLNQWKSGGYLHGHTKRDKIIGALEEDAMMVEKGEILESPGPKEKGVAQELNEMGQMNTAIPLITALTKAEKEGNGGGWSDFEKAMVALYPKMEFGIEKVIIDKVINFYNHYEGYKKAFESLKE